MRMRFAHGIGVALAAAGVAAWLFVGSAGRVQAQGAGAQPPAARGAGARGAAPAGAPQAPGGGAPGAQAARGPAAPPQGGTGPIKVLFVTKFHPFDREGLFSTLDALGTEITWTHVEEPASLAFFNPELAKDYDVFMFFDAPGRTRLKKPDGTEYFEDPGPVARKNFQAFLQTGKGMVFLHHSIAAWNHTWPEYSETIGGACDWGNPVTFRGKTWPNSGAVSPVKEHVTVVDKTSPIVKGIGDGFDITDEMYLCPYAEDSVHPLLRSDFKAIDSNFTRRYEGGWRYPGGEGSNLAGWTKTAGINPVVYLRNGHDKLAWDNPAWRMLVTNAIKWAASPEAKAWAKANPTKIYK
jgi:type 1 glutamine amidotransferase